MAKAIAVQSADLQFATDTQSTRVPDIKVWGPRDKLPKNVIGQGVAGNFVTYGEDINGGLVLVAEEDKNNAFARKFVVTTRTSGIPRNSFLPSAQQRLVKVPRDQPLIFIKHDSFMGEYTVQDSPRGEATASVTSPQLHSPPTASPAPAPKKRLTASDVGGLSLDQVQTVINEVYGHYGVEFPKMEVQAWADRQPWYHRVPGRTQEMAEPYFSEDDKWNIEILATRRDVLKQQGLH